MPLRVALAETGHRVTGPRKTILKILQQSSSPLSPEEIWQKGRKAKSGLGLTTVYRALVLFEQKGWVRRAHCPDGCHRYLAAGPGHCHTIVCRRCGQAEEFPAQEDLSQTVQEVSVRTGFLVEDHLLQLTGLCPRCRSTERTG
jgi:Fe2+ or Zn2+ uptake regulation protein